jgi:hypothetical protein
MSDSAPSIPAASLGLLPYQSRLVEFLKHHDRDVWNWFASARTKAKQSEELKFDLLKSTYRIERDSQPDLYQTADEVARFLGLSAPITIYQAQDPAGLNASLAYLPAEIHLVLHGPLITQLSPVELRGLIGHEFTHFLLWQGWNGELLTAAEMLAALTNDRQAHPAHFASWRLLRLYNEIICDRGALLVTQDMRAVVSLLVKVQTGVQEIDPDSYLRQADEIFARGTAKTEGITHPEAFIRARAIKLWADDDPDAPQQIAQMIEAGTDLKEIDLLGQEAVAGWTRRVIDLLLSHKWFQSDLILGHARLYFDDYKPPTDALTDPKLSSDVRLDTKSARDYFCYVLLDFVSADRELDEPPLAAALQVAEDLGIKQRFIEVARQELRLRKNQIEKVDDRKAAILLEADKSAAAAT